MSVHHNLSSKGASSPRFGGGDAASEQYIVIY